MREWESDRLLFFEPDAATPRARAAACESQENTWGAVLFLACIVLALGAALFALVSWHLFHSFRL